MKSRALYRRHVVDDDVSILFAKWNSRYIQSLSKNTLSALGFLQACLNKSSEANLLRLHSKSAHGPISSSSTLGILVSDFFKSILVITLIKETIFK